MPASKTNDILRPDDDFSAWVEQYWAALYAWWTEQGLNTEALSALEKHIETWRIAYPEHVAAQAAAESARHNKDTARAPRPRRAHFSDHDDQAQFPRPPLKTSSTRAKAAKWGAAVYMARWVNTRGKKGPWSEVTTATVAA